MPFYEFYCDACHRIYTFFSRSVQPDKTPPCPKCSLLLQRVISNFFVLKDMHPSKDNGGFLRNENSQLIQAQAFLSSELRKIDQNDPKQMATVLKKLGDMTGNHLGQELQTVLAQIEKGGDINSLQLEMESILSKYEEKTENEFGVHKEKPSVPPSPDPNIYEM